MKTSLCRYLDFDLTYLALLTRNNLKRLSRWEGDLSDEQIEVLRDLGLEVARVRRRLRLGRKTGEVVFARRRYYADFYMKRFHMTHIKESPGDVRLQGFLFGYPSCCVEEFIRHPYSGNSLSRDDQKILFHWACSGCKTTPRLLREYRAIHRECLKIFGVTGASEVEPLKVRRDSMGIVTALQRKAAPVAVGLSALLLTPGFGVSHEAGRERGGLPVSSDPHLLPVADDLDTDYLSDAEEIIVGTDRENPDTDGDSVPDGVSEGVMLYDLISALPASVQADEPYKQEFWARGLEYCDVCGEPVNMGFVRIVNPRRNLEVDLPFLALHYLEHGSLSYAGSLHNGRADMAMLKRVLLATDTSHLIFGYHDYDPDTDGDGLSLREETIIGTDADSSDTDNDSVKDGPQYLEGLVELLSTLPREVCEDQPYLIEYQMYGLETCSTCGATFNMGYAEIVNPVEGMTLEVPFVGLHYLAHGSGGYEGSEHSWRVLPIALDAVLTGDGSSHWLPVEGDTDGDGLKDVEEPHFSYDPAEADTDGDGLPDGPELAMMMAETVMQLPEGESEDSTYVIHNLTYGIFHCLICDTGVNMGYMDIVNPVAGTSTTLSYLSLHYMEHGSFATDFPDWFPRVDPVDLDAVLGVASSTPIPGPRVAPLLVYPNPFRSITNIVCNVPGSTGVEVAFYDASGRLVRELAVPGDGSETSWDGRDADGRKLPPGVYLCKMKTGELRLSRKVVLLE